MGVPKQHAWVSVSAYERNFRQAESAFKEPGHPFVPKVVKPEVSEASPLAHMAEGLVDRVWADREQAKRSPR
jgi:hypothetical protein